MTTTTQGSQQKIILVESGDSAGVGQQTFDNLSEPYSVVSESMMQTKTIVEAKGLRGTRSKFSATTREGTRTVSGTLVLEPTKDDLDNWLPRILGGTESGDSFPLAETLPPFAILVDKLNATASKMIQFHDCVVGKATFSGTSGEPLKLALDIVGVTALEGQAVPGTYPALADVAASAQPFMFEDLALNLAGARTAYDITLTIDNHLEVKHGSGSQDPSSITPTDRTVQLSTNIPWNSSEYSALYQLALAGASGSAIWTGGGATADVFSCVFGAMQLDENKTPTTGGKGEVAYPLTFTCRKPDNATDEIVVTNTNA